MKPILDLSKNNDYRSWVKELKQRYLSARLKASIEANRTLLEYYWNLGRDIADKQYANTYESGFYKTLSHDLRSEMPEEKGFSESNIRYIYRFYQLYSQLFENLPQGVEKDALVANVTKFLVELGTGFAYMGRQYRMQVGEKEIFIDLLFYNTRIHAYCCIELKTGSFQASYLGQLGLYVTAVNHQLKTEHDNPTIGLLIYKDKDNIEAQYSLEAYNLPLGISQYELSKLIPNEIKSSLPSIEEIESTPEQLSEEDKD